ncbi:MAG: PEP-CTERM sorting domain-containing protein [Candidatus Eisenbacteria bacterium]
MKHLFVFVLAFAMLFGAVTANGSILLQEDFEGDLPDWWHVTGDLWHVEDYRSYSGDKSLAYNWGAIGFYDYWTGDSANYGITWTPTIDVSGSGEVYFELYSWLDTENVSGQDSYAWDTAQIEIYDEFFNYYYTFTPDMNFFDHQQWNQLGVYGGFKSVLDGFGLSEFRLGFYFDTVDGIDNFHEGWYIDDVTVWDDTQTPPIPEPSTWLLLSTGLLGAVPIARRKFRR